VKASDLREGTRSAALGGWTALVFLFVFAPIVSTVVFSFNADRFPSLLQSLNPRIAVTILPGPGHLATIADAGAVSMVATMWRQMGDQARGR